MDILTTATYLMILLALLLLGGEVGLLSKYYKNPVKEHLLITVIFALCLMAVVAIFSNSYEFILKLFLLYSNSLVKFNHRSCCLVSLGKARDL